MKNKYIGHSVPMVCVYRAWFCPLNNGKLSRIQCYIKYKCSDTKVLFNTLCDESFHHQCVNLQNNDAQVFASNTENAKQYCGKCNKFYSKTNTKIIKYLVQFEAEIVKEIQDLEALLNVRNISDKEIPKSYYQVNSKTHHQT